MLALSFDAAHVCITPIHTDILDNIMFSLWDSRFQDTQQTLTKVGRYGPSESPALIPAWPTLTTPLPPYVAACTSPPHARTFLKDILKNVQRPPNQLLKAQATRAGRAPARTTYGAKA